jgi:hypothetical protein
VDIRNYGEPNAKDVVCHLIFLNTWEKHVVHFLQKSQVFVNLTLEFCLANSFLWFHFFTFVAHFYTSFSCSFDKQPSFQA